VIEGGGLLGFARKFAAVVSVLLKAGSHALDGDDAL
jgi:hypothetical protein